MGTPRNWLITGCSSGFGRALAEAVLAGGDNAVVTARRTDSVQDLVQRYPDNASAVALDLQRPEQIASAAEAAEKAFGGIDVLVNNAGFGVIGAIEEMTPEEYRPMFETNFFGTIELTRAMLPAMRQRGHGHIVNISSIAGISSRPGYGFYASTKFALEGASEALAGEMAPLGIRVTLVEPGPFRTDFAGRSLQMAARTIEDYAPTAGASREAIAQRNGRQSGDPARAAEIIIAAVNAPEPPLRLPLGSYAYGRLRDKVAAMTKDADTWEPAAGAAAEFPD